MSQGSEKIENAIKARASGNFVLLRLILNNVFRRSATLKRKIMWDLTSMHAVP